MMPEAGRSDVEETPPEDWYSLFILWMFVSMRKYEYLKQKMLSHGLVGVSFCWVRGLGYRDSGTVSYTHLTLPTNREV